MFFLYYFIVRFVAKLPYARFGELFTVFTAVPGTLPLAILVVLTCVISLFTHVVLITYVPNA